MAKRDVAIETPGAVDEAKPAAPVAADLTPTQETKLKAELAETAKLVGAPGALDWSHLNQAAVIQNGSVAGPEYPDQSQVDAATLREPVLTKQGWVLPLNDPRARFGGR